MSRVRLRGRGSVYTQYAVRTLACPNDALATMLPSTAGTANGAVVPGVAAVVVAVVIVVVIVVVAAAAAVLPEGRPAQRGDTAGEKSADKAAAAAVVRGVLAEVGVAREGMAQAPPTVGAIPVAVTADTAVATGALGEVARNEAACEADTTVKPVRDVASGGRG